MIHSGWGQAAVIVAANLFLFAYIVRKAAREAGREDWVRAVWEVRRELVPNWLKR